MVRASNDIVVGYYTRPAPFLSSSASQLPHYGGRTLLHEKPHFDGMLLAKQERRAQRVSGFFSEGANGWLRRNRLRPPFCQFSPGKVPPVYGIESLVLGVLMIRGGGPNNPACDAITSLASLPPAAL
jgi:hypothetical protein